MHPLTRAWFGAQAELQDVDPRAVVLDNLAVLARQAGWSGSVSNSYVNPRCSTYAWQLTTDSLETAWAYVSSNGRFLVLRGRGVRFFHLTGPEVLRESWTKEVLAAARNLWSSGLPADPE